MADLVAQEGYAATTVAGVAKRAGVSTRAFYEHFGDKQECLLAVYDLAVRRAQENMGGGDGAELPWQERLANMLRRWFELLAAEPSFTRIYALEIWHATPATRQRAVEGTIALVSVLRRANDAARSEDPDVLEATEIELQMLAGGMHRLTVLHAAQDRIAELPQVVDEVIAFAVAGVSRRRAAN